jgi:hypothetical protein
MSTRSNVLRFAIFALLLSRAPRAVQRALAFMLLGAVLAFVLIALGVAARSEPLPPPEYEACHAGDRAACKQWRVRECRDGNSAACDYDEAHKQCDPMKWCVDRHYPKASQYRFCLNGSPDR